MINYPTDKRKLAAKQAWETRRKNGTDKRSAEHTAKLVACHTGKKRTEETKLKMSISLKKYWEKRKNEST